jgi:hypothetical protein
VLPPPPPQQQQQQSPLRPKSSPVNEYPIPDDMVDNAAPSSAFASTPGRTPFPVSEVFVERCVSIACACVRARVGVHSVACVLIASVTGRTTHAATTVVTSARERRSAHVGDARRAQSQQRQLQVAWQSYGQSAEEVIRNEMLVDRIDSARTKKSTSICALNSHLLRTIRSRFQ